MFNVFSGIILTTFECPPYEIFILQDSKGELLTIKIYEV
jgi:hypothetical protein